MNSRSLSDRPGAAVDLVERAPSFNVAVVLIARPGPASAPTAPFRNRLADTVGSVIAYQIKQPHDVAALADTAKGAKGWGRPRRRGGPDLDLVQDLTASTEGYINVMA